jgi:DNA/RNA-binding domain of Phe-tRNA-synthetase-like protein
LEDTKERRTVFFQPGKTWSNTYPGASAGILVMRNVSNPRTHPGLEAQREAVETSLRARYGDLGRGALEAVPAMRAYTAYYRSFNKTYHVLLQLESVAIKQKPIPTISTLLTAMFSAELENMLLTAGHDLERVDLPVEISIATGSESYRTLSGKEQTLKQGDMFMADRQGVISSILYGPDQRTQIRPETREVLFAVYAPEGIAQDDVNKHLQRIEELVKVVSPMADTTLLQVYTA